MLINDRYELRKEIRRGGFGVTWYAWDTNLDMPVAVKEFSDPDPEHRRKFIREARSLAKVSGTRGIVNVRDYLEVDGKAYMVMEYLDGEDLSTRIDRTGRLSPDETWQLLLPVMSVLTKLHEAGMIHRDVSPDNIRITEEGEVKLLDFGSVSNLTSENLTRTVTVKPGYAPIEQYSGAAEQGPWTDVYSLCATIYKCVTGRKPVDSLVRSIHDELERPSALGVKISPEEEAVLMKGLSVDPRERYGSIVDFENAMEAAGIRPKYSSGPDVAGGAGVGTGRGRSGSQSPAGGSSSGGRSFEDLAAKAFSDNEESGKEEKAAPVHSVQSKNDMQPSRQMHPGSSAKHTVKSTVRTTDQEKEVQAGAARKKSTGSAPKKAPSQSGGQGHRKKNKFLIPAVLAGILVLGVVGFVIFSGGSEGGFRPTSITTGQTEGVEYKSGDTYITISDAVVNDAHIDFVEKNEKITAVYFRRCSISDEMISRMAEWTRVDSISFNYCDGFTTQDPLSGLVTLKSIELYDHADVTLTGNQLFTVDFPKTLKSLSITCGTLAGTTGFIRHFPGLSSLTLNVENQIEDYSFLDVLPEFEELRLFNQSMDEEDCSHLGGHKELTLVELTDGTLATLDWAKECPKIQYISAHESPITDLSPLADHEKLYELSLPGSQVSDLTPLSSCPKLTVLNVSRSQVGSLDGLEHSEELYTLNISRCGVSDLTPLSGCINLHHMFADRNKIISLNGISKCTRIQILNVNRNELTNLDGCQDLIKLESLQAAGNHITDISGIRNCTAVENLLLSENGIEDISALSNNFLDLKVLDVSDNQIRDISALAGCVSLSVFAADNNKLTSVNALADKHDLYGVFLSNNELSDITPLRESMDNLSYLDIGNNGVKDISFLNKLSVKRVWLFMENNEISDLSMLPAMLGYQRLVFYGNPIQDVSVMNKLQNAVLAEFYVSHNDNFDYSALGDSPVNDSVFLVDVPSDKKASVLKQFKKDSIFEPTFMSSEEADREMAAYREEIRGTVLGDSEEEETENESLENTAAEPSAEVPDDTAP